MKETDIRKRRSSGRNQQNKLIEENENGEMLALCYSVDNGNSSPVHSFPLLNNAKKSGKKRRNCVGINDNSIEENNENFVQGVTSKSSKKRTRRIYKTLSKSSEHENSIKAMGSLKKVTLKEQNPKISNYHLKATSCMVLSPNKKEINTSTRWLRSKDVAAFSKENIVNDNLHAHDEHFMRNLCAGYKALYQVFQFLTIYELLQASCVCRMWHNLGNQPSLWKTIRMKNTQVVDWLGFADALHRHETEHLDLRKMIFNKHGTMWDDFCCVIDKIPTLRQLDLSHCPMLVIERVAEKCPQLESITATTISSLTLNLNILKDLWNLQILELKSCESLHIMNNLDTLMNFTNLKHLSLTTFKELGKEHLDVLSSLLTLESLELGDFSNFPENFGSCLTNLSNLHRLRLEHGEGKTCPTFKVLLVICMLPNLVQLELINFDIRPGFDKALETCTNIRRLLIIPTYRKQLATTNKTLLNAVLKLSASLEQFVWGMTVEMLLVTKLFAKCIQADKNNITESIPVLRPVPGLQEDVVDNSGTALVHVLSLSMLQMLLHTVIPKTKVKILRFPFKYACQQQIGRGME